MKSMPRWSFAAFLFILAAGLFGPLLFANGPQSTVAKPFAPPAWMGGEAPPPLSASLSPEQPSLSIDWKWTAPENISIRGTVLFDDSPANASLVWETLLGTTILWLVGLIPVVGPVITILGVIFTLGSGVILLGRHVLSWPRRAIVE